VCERESECEGGREIERDEYRWDRDGKRVRESDKISGKTAAAAGGDGFI
jgi:hypothetical protein